MSHTCKYTEKNSEFEGKTPFEARVSEFLRKLTIELQMLYARNLGFLHISSKNPVDADIANRKHYSAPAGTVTFFNQQLSAYIIAIHCIIYHQSLSQLIIIVTLSLLKNAVFLSTLRAHTLQ